MTHERITQHEDWKDGIDAFRLQVSEEIAEIYKSIAGIRSLTLKLAEVVMDNYDPELRNKAVERARNETKITEGDTP